jgi:prevent-host-death family protein
MRQIQLRQAKAALSAVVDDAVRGKPSIITRHGKPQAVVVGFEDWRRGRLLMSAPVTSGDLPPRDPSPMRDVEL